MPGHHRVARVFILCHAGLRARLGQVSACPPRRAAWPLAQAWGRRRWPCVAARRRY